MTDAGGELRTTGVLALASCQYPPGLLHEHVAYRSVERLAEKLLNWSGSGVDRCLMLAGDAVYVDPTAGLFDPERPRDKFESPYGVLLTPQWQALSPLVRKWFITVDDHEFMDNWEPTAAEPHPALLPVDLKSIGPLGSELLHGKRAFGKFTRRLPGDLPDAELLARPLWYADRQGEILCFVMDTRTERELRTAAGVRTARMVGDRQLRALQAWLLELHTADEAAPGRAPVPKFILSGSMLLPRRQKVADSPTPGTALLSDAWDGYPATMTRVLELIARCRIRNVVFLSGDEHLSCLARISLQYCNLDPVAVHSVHASPLYGPYPFANAKPWHFAESETFALPVEGPATTTVRVSTHFAEIGDGFGLIVVQQDRSGYSLRVTFSGLEAEVIDVVSLQ